jgi:hypothetical protein
MDMPTIGIDAETTERLDSLRVDGEFYDETITGLIGVYEAEELMPFNSE